jgi:hypothetical protein
MLVPRRQATRPAAGSREVEIQSVNVTGERSMVDAVKAGEWARIEVAHVGPVDDAMASIEVLSKPARLPAGATVKFQITTLVCC